MLDLVAAVRVRPDNSWQATNSHAKDEALVLPFDVRQMTERFAIIEVTYIYNIHI
jgi:hypothetical protein